MSLEKLEAADTPNRREDGTLEATSVSIATCSHGTVFIRLHGPDGAIFARASLGFETGLDFAAAVDGALEAAGKALGMNIGGGAATEAVVH